MPPSFFSPDTTWTGTQILLSEQHCAIVRAFFFLPKHPHGRGEDLRPAVANGPTRETPPRAWGRPAPKVGAGSFIGNTPTGVGKTGFLAVGITSPEKHPHGRGEDASVMQWAIRREETPPRAWGRPVCNLDDERGIANTPTGVGKTGYVE